MGADRKLFAVVPDGTGGTNLQGFLRGGFLFRGGGLLGEEDVRLIGIIFEQRGRFLQAIAARDAGIIHVPFAGDVFGQFTVFIGHKFLS